MSDAKPAKLGSRTEVWYEDTLINRLERCRLFLVSGGVLVPSEDVEVARRIDIIRATKETCESTFDEVQS